jgi:hypothetical protein
LKIPLHGHSFPGPKARFKFGVLSTADQEAAIAQDYRPANPPVLSGGKNNIPGQHQHRRTAGYNIEIAPKIRRTGDNSLSSSSTIKTAGRKLFTANSIGRVILLYKLN